MKLSKKRRVFWAVVWIVTLTVVFGVRIYTVMHEKARIITEAKMYLDNARKEGRKEIYVDHYIHLIKNSLSEADIPLSAIGTSEEELRNLSIKWFLADAKFWLHQAREADRFKTTDWLIPTDKRHYAWSCILLVQSDLKEAGGLPLTIGTSDEELRRLVKRWD